MGVADQEQLLALRRQVDAAFDRAIGRPERVALLCYPYDGNVGNHMMWVAITDHLARNGIQVAYAAHINVIDVDGLRQVIGTDPILFSGGVTMSRLWPSQPATRRRIAAAFPDNRLVSLTSTMLFADEDDERAAADMFGGHDQVVLMARDPISASQAERVYGDTVETVLVHDSAFGLTPIETELARAPDGSILWLHRDDLESAGVDLPPGVSTFEWAPIEDPVYRRPYLHLRASGAVNKLRQRISGRPKVLASRAVAAHYRTASRSLVRTGAEILARHRVLVTDRMHPHLLSTLIGQPVVLLPDRYGKNRAVYEYSSSRFSGVHWADEPAEALELARDLASQPIGDRP